MPIRLLLVSWNCSYYLSKLHTCHDEQCCLMFKTQGTFLSRWKTWIITKLIEDRASFAFEEIIRIAQNLINFFSNTLEVRQKTIHNRLLDAILTSVKATMSRAPGGMIFLAIGNGIRSRRSNNHGKCWLTFTPINNLDILLRWVEAFSSSSRRLLSCPKL